MAGWSSRCAARLDEARKALAFDGAAVKIEGNAVGFNATVGPAMYAVRVTRTSPSSPARNSWNPARDTWVDLPIIDKSYSTQKLNLFRWSEKLEASIAAYRGDDSRRSPPVPAWLKRFVDVM